MRYFKGAITVAARLIVRANLVTQKHLILNLAAYVAVVSSTVKISALALSDRPGPKW